MKLKYYMRGIGIGVLVTTIILVIAFAFSGNNMSDEEIINIITNNKLSVEEKVEDLKNLALLKGGFDNTTIILVRK